LLWAVMFIDGSILNIFDCSIIGGYFLALHDADVSYYYSRLIFRKRVFSKKSFKNIFGAGLSSIRELDQYLEKVHLS